VLESRKIILPISTILPSDWSHQVSALAALNDIEAFEVRELPGGEALINFRAPALGDADIAQFKEAVQATLDEVRLFLAPRPPTYAERLSTAAQLVKSGKAVQTTGRELLSWFGAARRGARVVEHVRAELARHDLVTDPDFNDVWVDIPLAFKTKPPPASVGNGAKEAAQSPPASGQMISDPVHRIGRLEAANQKIVSVPVGTSINVAATTMLLRDFSQLPVMRNERDCRGVVSWQSIGLARALGHPCNTVDDCLSPVEDIPADSPLLDAIERISSRGFVLVRANDRRYQGIVTASDISHQFRFLSEPFLLLGQIENHIRVLVGKSFSLAELQAAKNPADVSREIGDVSDLSFGEYVRLMESPAGWVKLKAHFAREPFLDELRTVLAVRNDVMHFDPEPLENDQVQQLRNLAAFLERAVVMPQPSSQGDQKKTPPTAAPSA
jgi:CBS domain-containing protein